MSEGDIRLTSIEDRERAWREHTEAKLKPVVDGVNEVLGTELEIVWNKGSSALFGHKLGLRNRQTGKFVTVYLNPSNMRRRLEFLARVVGAEPCKVDGYV